MRMNKTFGSSIILILFLFTFNFCNDEKKSLTKSDKNKSYYVYDQGAIVRTDTTKKIIHLVFTGDSYADGADTIIKVLNKHSIKAMFFFTGNFYRNKKFANYIERLIRDGHYLGAHSDKHLLYAAWSNRDSLLVTKEQFREDLINNYIEMSKFGICKNSAKFFIPPYEWYNTVISGWTKDLGLTLINYTQGTKSHADWTTPDMGARYVDSDQIFTSILEYEGKSVSGLNGFILLSHIGSDPLRTDKFYYKLDELLGEMVNRGYVFKILE